MESRNANQQVATGQVDTAQNKKEERVVKKYIKNMMCCVHIFWC